MKCKLSDICCFVNEKILVSSLTKFTYISTENMLPKRGGIVEASTLPTIAQTQAFKKGDVLVSNIRPYFKKIWQATFDGGCSNDVLVFRANKQVDANFLYYVLAADDFFNYATGTSKGTKMPRGDKVAIMQYSVPNLPLSLQIKMAKTLSSLDDKIELNTAINHNLLQQAFALFDSLFPNISDGLCTIGDYITPKRGRNLLSKDAVPGTVPVVAGGLEPSTYHNTANTQAPVLTISASGANAGFVNLWHKPVWSSDSSFIDSSMTEDVYFWFIMLKKRQREIFDAQTGSAQPHIYPQHIAAMTIRSLDQALISDFTSQVTPLFALIGANKDENDRLTSVRDALLPKLMSGEIDVSEIEV